jgi:hypothetical protein
LVVMGLRDIERRIPIRGEEGGEGEGSGFREPLMGPVRSDVSCTRRTLLSRGLTESSHAAAGEGRGSGTTVPVESQRGDRGLEGDTQLVTEGTTSPSMTKRMRWGWDRWFLARADFGRRQGAVRGRRQAEG